MPDKAAELPSKPAGRKNELAAEHAWEASRLYCATLLKRVYSIDALAYPLPVSTQPTQSVDGGSLACGLQPRS